MVTVIPAIDIFDGQFVRFRQGDPSQPTIARPDPAAIALAYAGAGARRLHVVDLGGAIAGDGGRPGLGVLREIAAGSPVPVQYGGGLRSLDDLRAAVDAGARWVITGTAAVADPGFLTAAAAEFGDRLILAVDLRAGQLLIRGWQTAAPLGVDDLLDRAVAAGVRQIMVTDASSDGTLRGLQLSTFTPFLDRGMAIVAAGGAAALSDIAALAGWGAGRGLTGIVVGSALLSGDFTLAEAQAAATAAASAAVAPAARAQAGRSDNRV